jgi:hypothetical protein
MSNPTGPVSFSGSNSFLHTPGMLRGVDVNEKDAMYGFTISADAILSGLSPVDGTLQGMYTCASPCYYTHACCCIPAIFAAMATTLNFNGQAVATFTLPSIAARANTDNYISLSSPVTITSMAVFTQFAQALLDSELISFSLTGMASVSTSVAGTEITISDIPFSKTITFPGAGGLKQSVVKSFSLATSNATSAKAVMLVEITSACPVSILPLGDLAVNVFYQGMLLGTMVTEDASLLAGTSSFQFSGVLTPDNVTLVQDLIGSYLANIPVNVSAVGVDTWPTSIPLYKPVIQFLQLNTSLVNLGPPLVHGMNVDSMYLTPAGPSAVGIQLNATVQVNNILGPNSPIVVQSIAMNVSLQGAGVSLGQLVVPSTPVTTRATGPTSLLASDEAGQELVLHMSPVGSDGGERRLSARYDDDIPILNVTMSLIAVLDIDTTAVEFSQFILAFLSNSTVNLGLVGPDRSAMTATLACVLGTLTVQIPLNAQTSVPGIDSFPYVSVDSFSVSGTTNDPPAVLVDMAVSLLNPSPASFPLGSNATLGIYYKGFRLGGSVAYNCTLLPGMNTLYLSGAIAPDMTHGPDALAATSELFSQYLSGVNADVSVVGETVFLGPGIVTPQWLVDAVHNISIAAVLPGAANLTVFSEVQMQSFSMNFTTGEGNPPLMAGIVSGNIHLPFSIPVDIPAINMSLVFNDPVSLQPMASIALVADHVKYTPVPAIPSIHNSPIVGELVLYLDYSPLNVINVDLFAAFMKDALLQPYATMLLTGGASPIVSLVIGNLSISNMPVYQFVTSPGMSGLSNPPVEIISVDVTSTTPENVTLVAVLNITNPSVVSGSYGPIALALEYIGIVLQVVHMDNLVMVPGENIITTSGTFGMPDPNTEPIKYAAARGFLSRYLSGIDSSIRMLGVADSSPFPLLLPAFSALNATGVFPGVTRHLLRNGTLYMDVDLSKGLPTAANGTLTTENPLSTDLQIMTANLTVWDCASQYNTTCNNSNWGDAIGYFYRGDLSLKPLIVPAHSIRVTRPYELSLIGMLPCHSACTTCVLHGVYAYATRVLHGAYI